MFAIENEVKKKLKIIHILRIFVICAKDNIFLLKLRISFSKKKNKLYYICY